MDSEGKIQLIRSLRNNYKRLQLAWWVTHYAIGVFGIIAGAWISFFKTMEAPESGIPLAVLGGITVLCTGLVTFLAAQQKASKYKKAYYQIDQALLEFDGREESLPKLLQKVESARETVLAGDG